jgi:large subunit ribosomal protein L21
MFAIVRTGGKQIKVQKNDLVSVEKLEAEVGKEIVLDQVLLLGDDSKTTVGQPFVEKAQVKAKVEEQTRTKKVIVFKKKRRQNYRRKKGHRQHQTVLKIIDIIVDGKSVAGAGSTPAPKKTEAKKEAPKKDAPNKAEAKKK